MKNNMLLLAAGSLTFLFAPAFAASFVVEHGVNPTACNSSSNSGPFATGQVITYSPQDCLGGYSVFLDTAARTITFTTAAAPFADYRFSEFNVTGITEVAINSLTAIQTAPLFNTSSNPAPSLVLSFTSSSINILFGTRSSSTPIFDFSTNGGQAVFAYNTLAAVPEPATWAMMIVGFGLVGGAMRQRSRTKVTYA